MNTDTGMIMNPNFTIIDHEYKIKTKNILLQNWPNDLKIIFAMPAKYRPPSLLNDIGLRVTRAHFEWIHQMVTNRCRPDNSVLKFQSYEIIW